MTDESNEQEVSISKLELSQLLAALVSPSANKEDYLNFELCDKLELIELANLNFLNFALYDALRSKGLLRHLSTQEQQYLQEFFDLNKERNEHFITELKDIVAVLNDHGIEPVLLKGSVALLDNWYEERGGRFLRDVDFLVPAGQGDQAFSILKDMGYKLVNSLDEDLHEIANHHLAGLCKEGSALVVEIHTEPLSFKAKGILEASAVFEDKTPISSEGFSRCFIPSPAHCLVIALAHSEISDDNREKGIFFLRHAMDISRILNRYTTIDLCWVDNAFDKAGFETLFSSYLQVFNFFFPFDSQLTVGVTSSAKEDDEAYLERVKKVINQQSELKGAGPEELKRAHLKQIIRNAFSRHRISQRYGVTNPIGINIYRLVNLFRLIRKYVFQANRQKLDQSVNEALSTKSTLGDE